MWFFNRLLINVLPPPLINLLEEPAVLFVQVGIFYLICINKMQIGALMQLDLPMCF